MTNNFTQNFLFLLRCLVTSSILFLGFYQSSAQTSIGGDKVDYKEPQKYRIAGISVMGVVYSDVQAIKLVSGLQEGQLVLIPGDDISEAIRKLWKQKLFTDISISVAEFRGEDVFLLIQLKEMPRLGKYRVEGLRKSETDNVREKLDLRTGVVCNENLKAIAVNKIQDYYLEKGFYNCTVALREEPDPLMQNSVVLIFDVKRGNRMKIEYITLDGVSQIPAKKIYRTMKDTKRRKWWNVFKSSKFIEEKYEEDKDKIIARYNKEGFRNAKIVSDTIFAMNSERLVINMKIEEGAKFYFRNIKFLGNVKYRTSTLDSVLNIQKGDIYNVELLQNRLNYNPAGLDVSSLYTDDGYLTFYAYPVETLIEPDSIDVEVRMSEGKQFRIGKISVLGNTKTNDHVIFREIRTRPGELFNRTDIIRTQRELANLGYFDPAAFDVHTIPREEEGLVDLEYVVEEKPSDQIQLSGGWGGQRIVGSLSLNFSNFSMRNIFKKGAWSPLPTGDGQRFSISASSNGLFFRSFNASFTEPWFGGKKPNSLTFSAWNSRQTNGIRQKDQTLTNPYQRLEILGGSVSFGKRLQKPDDYFLLYTGLSYQHFSLNNYGSFFSFKDGTSNNLALNFTLERNSVSEPIYPVSGSKINFTTKFTPPIKQIRELFGAEFDYPNLTDAQKFDWVEYYKLKFTAHWYTALNKHKERKFVLHTNVGFGFLGTYNNKLGQSPFERFYLGGVYLSGFLLDGREIVNLRGYDDLSLTTPNQNVGAPVISKYGMELRYPLSTNPQATIYALTFVEAARTWSNFKDYNPFNLYRSAGAGLRIFLPMFGLLGFDYGWRLDDVPNEPRMARGQFHFSIGMNLGEL